MGQLGIATSPFGRRGLLDPLSVNKKIRQKLWPYLEIKKPSKLQAVINDIKQFIGTQPVNISSVETYLSSRYFDNEDIAIILVHMSKLPDCKIESNYIGFK